ncbi:long-chain-fatty-acid--CoA ligase LcfA (plasmid) [Cupriavidus oxalaticus]|uniref:Long-chain-fatty-acid--CoA ligase LcfA n=1 Tax=Cupriavidus oxalaticus TaxID=96344 RepID=A0A5P3VU19_9BURK|nr:long-chain-fatty-acid--CoA ligase LcfA [Cupriavidus oxalaticus]
MPRLTRHYDHWPAGVPRTLEVPDRNLYGHLEVNALATPDKVAIDYYGRQTTYGQLNDAVQAMAGYLVQRLGVQRGDRVLLLMQNCPQFVIAYYAVLRSDAAVVAMSPMSTPEEIAYYAEDSGARVLVTTQDMLARAQPLLDSGGLDHCVVGAASEFAGVPEDVPYLEIPDFAREPGRPIAQKGVHAFCAALAAGLTPGPMQARGADLAVVAYTSGTTGKPKGAMLSHRAFAHAITQRAAWLSDPIELSELVVLPVSHVAGMNVVNQALLVGRTVVMLSRWDASAALELIERKGIGMCCAVTPMLAELFARPDIGQRNLSSIHRLYGGATAMPRALARTIEKRLGTAYIESYGMTETCGASHINPPRAARRQCAGVPHINCDARVIDLQTGVELGPNEPGEIVMHTPTLFSGYWNKPEATADAVIEIDGKRFMRSGDIGYHDDDGFFYVTDRLKRMINASGLKVWPAEIEASLHDHPAVQEACVISARDPHRGETVKAFVVLRPEARGTLEPADVTAWARNRMAAYKVPRLVEFVDLLPRTSTGKILWRELQARQDRADHAQDSR